MTPLVSVIVPVYNGMRFLGAAIDSIEAQEYAPLEVIVVDDGSTDESPAFARARGIKVVEQSRRGVAAARNAGVAHAQGELLAFLDQDDLWFASKVSRQVEALAARPGHVSIVWQQFFLDEGIAAPDWFSRPDFLNTPQPGWAPSCIAFERETFRRVGPFDETLAQASDMDWFRRARELGIAVETIPELLVRRRLHGANDSGSPTAFGEIFTVLRAGLRRRRGEEQAS
jgi:glycosyltransferase involved in cell wall biosynthesis